MLRAPKPKDDLLRLETLRKLKILDTDPEERFDRFTRLAKKLFGTPIVLVSLVDADRQWFKSRQGLDAIETPRDISFCGHAICQNEVFVVADATQDERFADNPLVTGDPKVCFYAGYPLSGPEGRKVGTLCLIDTQPRGMTPNELELLKELGRMVEEELVIADFLRVDPTTGLTNRGGFELVADHVLPSCSRNDVPASLVLLRHVNFDFSCCAMNADERDRATIELAHLLMATFRDSDVIGRLSADIFAVLLSGARHHGVAEAMQRFMASLAKHNQQRAGDPLAVEVRAVAYDASAHADAAELIHAAGNAEALPAPAGKEAVETEPA